MYFILQLLHKWLIHKTLNIYKSTQNTTTIIIYNRKINEPEINNRWLKGFAMPSDYLWVGAYVFLPVLNFIL